MTIKTVGELKRALEHVPDHTPLRILNIEDDVHLTILEARHCTAAKISEEAERQECTEEDVRDSMMDDGVDENDLVLYIENI